VFGCLVELVHFAAACASDDNASERAETANERFHLDEQNETLEME
jgi:hypothetical protein